MKIQITFNVNDYDREVVNTFYGDSGKADYQTMRQFIENTVEAELEMQGFNLEQREQGDKETAERHAAEAEQASKGLGREIEAGEAEYG